VKDCHCVLPRRDCWKGSEDFLRTRSYTFCADSLRSDAASVSIQSIYLHHKHKKQQIGGPQTHLKHKYTYCVVEKHGVVNSLSSKVLHNAP